MTLQTLVKKDTSYKCWQTTDPNASPGLQTLSFGCLSEESSNSLLLRCTPLSPALREQRQGELCESKASLVYLASSSSPRASYTERPCFKKRLSEKQPSIRKPFDSPWKKQTPFAGTRFNNFQARVPLPTVMGLRASWLYHFAPGRQLIFNNKTAQLNFLVEGGF